MNQLLRDIARRLGNVVTRAIVLAVDDTQKVQELNALVDVGVKRTGVERFQNYGFTSKPKPGAEAVIVNLGGKGDHPIAVAVEDHRYRVVELEDGEVAVYNDKEAVILLKSNGDIEITPKSGQKLKINGPLDVDGAITASGDVSSEGTVTGDTDVVGGGKSLKTHTHSVTGTVSTAPGAVVFAPPGLTGGPT